MRVDSSHLLIGALGLTVVGLGGYVLVQEGRRPAPGLAARPPAQVAPAAAPGLEAGGLRIEVEEAVPADSSGHRATVRDPDVRNLSWSIQGGTLDPGTGGDTALWTAGKGDVILTCEGEDGAGRPRRGTVRIQVLGVPTLDRFEASHACLTRGQSARLGWAARDVQGLVLDPGAQNVLAVVGPGHEVKPVETTEYVLTARHASGLETSRRLVIKVVDPPELLSVAGAPPASDGSVAVTVTFKGGKAELRQGDTVVASGDTSPLVVNLSSPRPGTSYRVTVTNEAGTSVSSGLSYGPLPAAAKP